MRALYILQMPFQRRFTISLYIYARAKKKDIAKWEIFFCAMRTHSCLKLTRNAQIVQNQHEKSTKQPHFCSFCVYNEHFYFYNEEN